MRTATTLPCRIVAAGVLALAASLAPAHPLVAQGGMRTVEVGRQLDADSPATAQPLQVLVSYDVGSVVVHGAGDAMLYTVQLAYVPGRTKPVYSFDSAGRSLHVGLHRSEGRGGETGARPELRLDLARTVPIDLRLEMGASEADLDLGGMRITRLGIESGASDALLHFDAPNGVAMQLLSLDVGAASLRARGLGNARAREVRVNVGIGSTELDFGGDWAGDMNLDLQVALGSARLRVPEDVGVRIHVRRFLASFEREGFVRQGDYWYSPNWDTAPHKLHIRARTALGELEIVRGR
ncbi:MAG TPA: hypothetical protein VGE02_07765 [Gemmatimonadales bacterium]